jgi:23S rRNA pseudouridine2605 synthase
MLGYLALCCRECHPPEYSSRQRQIKGFLALGAGECQRRRIRWVGGGESGGRRRRIRRIGGGSGGSAGPNPTDARRRRGELAIKANTYCAFFASPLGHGRREAAGHGRREPSGARAAGGRRPGPAGARDLRKPSPATPPATNARRGRGRGELAIKANTYCAFFASPLRHGRREAAGHGQREPSGARPAGGLRPGPAGARDLRKPPLATNARRGRGAGSSSGRRRGRGGGRGSRGGSR